MWELALVYVCIFAAVAPPPATAPAVPATPLLEKVELGGETFELELVADDPSRARGLQGREEIEAHGGMLFVHPRPRPQSYWMAGCLVDIDILFLDSRGRVVAVHRMKVEPRREGEPAAAYTRRLRRYRSVRPAQFAIEVKAGTIDRLALEVGQTVELDLPRLKKLAR